jgi:hypothetical protein
MSEKHFLQCDGNQSRGDCKKVWVQLEVSYNILNDSGIAVSTKLKRVRIKPTVKYVNVNISLVSFFFRMIWINKKFFAITFQLWFRVCLFQYISNKIQRYTVYRYLKTALRISGGTFTHHQKRKQLYLQHLVFVTPLLLSAAIVEELEESNGVTNTRCYRYSCMRSWWWVVVVVYHPKHVDQFTHTHTHTHIHIIYIYINCVTLHLFGYIFEYIYDARFHEL